MEKSLSKQDTEFFTDMYLENYNDICSYVHHIYPSTMGQEDIVQEVFFQALSHLEKLKSHPNIVGWLYVTTRYITLQHIKKDKKQVIELSDNMTSGCDDYDGILLKESLGVYLTEIEMDLLFKYYGEKYTAKELAAVYEKTPGAIKKKIYRINDFLKKVRDVLFIL